MIACFFLHLWSPWRSERRGGGGGRREGSLPAVASTCASVHYSENKFLFQTINVKLHYLPQGTLQFGVRFEGRRNLLPSFLGLKRHSPLASTRLELKRSKSIIGVHGSFHSKREFQG